MLSNMLTSCEKHRHLPHLPFTQAQTDQMFQRPSPHQPSPHNPRPSPPPPSPTLITQPPPPSPHNPPSPASHTHGLMRVHTYARDIERPEPIAVCRIFSAK